MIAERRGFCPDCQKNVLYRRPAPSHLLHLILSIITAGIWLPVWFLVTFVQKPFRCPSCGYSMSHVKAILAIGAVLILGMVGLYIWTHFLPL